MHVCKLDFQTKGEKRMMMILEKSFVLSIDNNNQTVVFQNCCLDIGWRVDISEYVLFMNRIIHHGLLRCMFHAYID